MRGLPREVKACLMKAKESALLAVESYNRPGATFRSGGYVVLMVVAWTALFHAVFLKRGIKPLHVEVRSGHYVRYTKVDGDNKAWELAECIRQYFGDKNPPARKNLEFFVGLRNKIEHRSMPQLDDQVFGECQALLLNFEELLRAEFGEKEALNESLSISLQFSTITPRGKAEALRRLQIKTYPTVSEYVARFRSSLSTDVLASQEYSYKVFLIPKTGNHAASCDLAVEFVGVNSLDDKTRESYERMLTLLKTKEREVAYPGHLLAQAVATRVQNAIGLRFITNDHTRCWKHFKVRPPTNSKDKSSTDTRYCVYHEPFDRYTYTDDWVKLLVTTLSKPEKYQAILGRDATPVARAPDESVESE